MNCIKFEKFDTFTSLFPTKFTHKVAVIIQKGGDNAIVNANNNKYNNNIIIIIVLITCKIFKIWITEQSFDLNYLALLSHELH
jgi:hypothetical protein